MPRKPRFILPGEPQHIIVRGINREPIFYDDADYRYYLNKLKEAIDKHNCGIHAYVLMANHVHLLLTPKTERGISKAIQMLGRYYVQYFNYTYGRTGSLWEGRYKSTLVDTEQYLLTCCRYIELNPVRAGMVEHPSEYPWSSYQFNAVGNPSPLLKTHYKYDELGSTGEDQQRAYRSLFKGHIPENQLEEIRAATNKEWVLGSDYFKAKIEARLQRRATPLPRGGDRKSEEWREQHAINRH